MPNHCDTDLTISGPSAVLEEILSKHVTENGELNCDSVIPYPTRFTEQDKLAEQWQKDNPGKWEGKPKDGFNSGGYEWCCQNWGTKWGTYDGNGIHRSARSFSLNFMSAWNPPTPVLTKLAEMYPSVYISMDSYECGAGFQVIARWENGVCVREDALQYRGTRGG